MRSGGAGLGSATPPRAAALETLRRFRSGDLADRALERATTRLEPRDRAWTQELVFGTFRLRGRLDHLLAGMVKGGLNTLEQDVLDVLRLGMYQLLEMGSVPPYAAISQSVELVRYAGVARAAGLVNGVLQNVKRRGQHMPFPDPATNPVEHLATWGSHPQWLAERWVARWGAEQARALVEANNRRPELYIRPLGLSVADARTRLAEAGIEAAEVPFSPESLHIPDAAAPDVLVAVPAVVQDPAATLVIAYAAVPAGTTALDLCAAPGGKSAGLAAEGARVAAADLSWKRLVRVRENTARLALREQIAAVVADARHPPFSPTGAVLVDAPCTGTGTFRRHPDGRWRVTPDDLAALVHLQAQILDGAAGVVKSGGLLIYSTCSLEAEENELQIEAFLERRPDFALEPPADTSTSELTAAGYLTVLPQKQGVDGAFAARLRRTG